MNRGSIARLTAALAWPFRRSAARRLLREQDGVAAVEFGLVAAPFFAIFFAILETAMVFFAGQALETAASDSARLIMTGQADGRNLDRDSFRQEVCTRTAGLFDCSERLHVDVKTYESFARMVDDLNDPAQRPLDADGNVDNSRFSYEPGGPGDIVIVRLVYEWPVRLPFIGPVLTNMADGRRLMMATVAFRNEPYAGNGT